MYLTLAGPAKYATKKASAQLSMPLKKQSGGSCVTAKL